MSRICRRGASIAIAMLLSASGPDAAADELQPALFAVDETAEHEYEVLWKTSRYGGRPPATPQLPANCAGLTDPHRVDIDRYSLTRWRSNCNGGLIGRSISIDAAGSDALDVLVRIRSLDGTTQLAHLTSSSPSVRVAPNPGVVTVAADFFQYGVVHIVGGYDHLLFVFALILLIGRQRSVIIAVTAFTIAHSITLAAAALRMLRPPQDLVEVAIALSILLLAVEVARKEAGYRSLTIRYPWVVAFVFGLLHGFGFAAALLDVGLPEENLVTALLFFNLGVEAGQVAFILTILLLRRLPGVARTVAGAIPRSATHYAIGIVAAFWTIDRMAQLWL